jgi:hypothetical protein
MTSSMLTMLLLVVSLSSDLLTTGAVYSIFVWYSVFITTSVRRFGSRPSSFTSSNSERIRLVSV